MSAPLAPAAGAAHNGRDFSLFEQHQSQLRQLFLVEDKSVKQVKFEMETKYGFPETEAKIYEYGLQHLGFKKKLSIEKWIEVDARVKKRKEREGKETEVLLSGVLQPPDKIRRIISRHKKGRYLQEQGVRGPTPNYPEGILLRTPPLSPNMTVTNLPRNATEVPVASHQVCVMSGNTWQSIDFQEWSDWLRKQMMDNPGSMVHRLPYVPSSHLVLMLRKPDAVEYFAFQARAPPLTDPFDLSCGAAFRIQAHQYFLEELSKASIMLSNGQNICGVDKRRLLSWIGADTNVSILKDFFARNIPAIAATWAGLIEVSYISGSGEAFQTLVEIAFVAHDAKWIQQYSRTLLHSIRALPFKDIRTVARRLFFSEPMKQIFSTSRSSRLSCVHKGDIQMMSELYLAGERWKDRDPFRIYAELLMRPEPHESFANQRQWIQILVATGFNFNRKVDCSPGVGNVFQYFDRLYDINEYSASYLPFTDTLWIAGRYELYETIQSLQESSKTQFTIVGLIKASLEGKERLLSCFNSRPPWDEHQRLVLEKAFSIAAGFGYVSAIKSLGEAGVDPNVRTLISKTRFRKINWHPLMRAAAAKHFDTVRFLVEMGAELRSGLECFNPLAAAVWAPKRLSNARRLDQLKIVQYLLGKGLVHMHGADALIKAVVPPYRPREDEETISPNDFVPDEKIFDILVGKKLPLNDVMYHGMNLLHLAIDRGCNLRTVEFLISRGVQIHSHPCSWDRKTMLHSAVASQSKDRQKIVELLLRNGADCTTEHGGYTILEAALSVVEDGKSCSSLQLFSFLLDCGAQLSGPEEKSSDWVPIVTRLLRIHAPDAFIYHTIEAGADIHSPGAFICCTCTPLQYAIKEGRLNVAYQLIASGVDINAPATRKNGCTALQAACNPYGEVSLGFVQFLLDKGADINAPGSEYYGTALQCAINEGSMSAFCLLLDAGANIFGTAEFTTWESSALYTAVQRGRLDMLNMILESLASNGLLTKDICDIAIEHAGKGGGLATKQAIEEFVRSKDIDKAG
ncbi:ankyrin [Xylaria venustula]|nr:ankyrin [Xylaria venustula]